MFKAFYTFLILKWYCSTAREKGRFLLKNSIKVNQLDLLMRISALTSDWVALGPSIKKE